MSRTTPLVLLAIAATCGCAARGLVSKGDKLVEEQQWEQAIAAYGEAVAARPDDPLLAGKLDSARRAGAAAYHVEARKAEQSGDLVAALAAYDKALQLLPAHDGARTDGSKVRRLLRITENRVDEARARLAAGDCLGAKADLEGLYAYKQAFPVIEEARVAALEACFGKAVAAAGVLFALGDVTAAEAMLAEADAYYPGHPQVAALRAEASGTRAAEELAMQGHAALVDGDLDAALKAYRDSLARDPSRQDSTRGLQAAAARKVDQHLKGVSRLHRAGRWQEVLAAIQAALAVGLPDEQVRARLEALATDLRKRAAARLYRRGGRADAAGLFGAAWVWFRLAQLVGKPFSDAELKARVAVARMDRVVPYRVLLVPPTHGSVHGGLGTEIAQHLMRMLEKDLEGTRVSLTLDPNVQPPPDGILRGRLTAVSLAPPQVTEDSKPLSWQAPDRIRTNPALGEALGRYVGAATGGDVPAAQGALEVLQATPPTLHETPEPQPVGLPVLTAKRTSALGAELELYDRANDKVVTAAFSDADCELTDEGSPALQPLGAAEDLLALAGTAPLRRRLIIDLVDDLRGQLGPALRLAGLRFQRLADRVSGDARLHYLLLALVAGSPDAEDLRQEVLEATGYRFGEDTYDAAKLPR